MTTRQDFTLRQGETFQRIIRWETPPYVYRPITGITRAGPVGILVVGHGLIMGWRAAVVSALGMTEINAKKSPPRESEYHQVTVVDADNITINDINSAEFSAYTSGGYLQYLTPVDLTGYTAKMQIKDRIGGTVLLTLASEIADDPNQRIIIDPAGRTIMLNVAADDIEAADISWTKGVHDIEMRSPTGVKTRIYQGVIKVSKEVTT